MSCGGWRAALHAVDEPALLSDVMEPALEVETGTEAQAADQVFSQIKLRHTHTHTHTHARTHTHIQEIQTTDNAESSAPASGNQQLVLISNDRYVRHLATPWKVDGVGNAPKFPACNVKQIVHACRQCYHLYMAMQS